MASVASRFLVGLAALLGECFSGPFATCEGPRPDCIATGPLPPYGCVGPPIGQADCIDEDGDVHWYCWEGHDARGDVIRTECVDTFDGGTLPSEDAGPSEDTGVADGG